MTGVRPSDEHWNTVYRSKAGQDVSWFEALPVASIAMLESAGVDAKTCVIDVGGGQSQLIDYLLDRGLRCLTVLDVSVAALQRTKERLGAAGDIPVWIAADVTGDWNSKPVDVWHDRALFHFLTASDDRARYLAHLKATVKPGGTVIIATFAPDGPIRCSGLPVCRYSPETLAAELGDEFQMVESARHEHQTPTGSIQPFTYTRLIRAVGA